MAKRCYTPNKKKFTTKQSAKSSARYSAMIALKQEEEIKEFHAYKCKCGFYHLTKDPQLRTKSDEKTIANVLPDPEFVKWAQTDQTITRLGKHGKID